MIPKDTIETARAILQERGITSADWARLIGVDRITTRRWFIEDKPVPAYAVRALWFWSMFNPRVGDAIVRECRRRYLKRPESAREAK